MLNGLRDRRCSCRRDRIQSGFEWGCLKSGECGNENQDSRARFHYKNHPLHHRALRSKSSEFKADLMLVSAATELSRAIDAPSRVIKSSLVYSITVSARIRRESEIVSPSAALRL